MDKLTRSAIVVSVVLVGIAIFYYLVLFLPQQAKEKLKVEQARLELQKKTEEDKKQAEEDKKSEENLNKLTNSIALNSCLDNVQKEYERRWNSTADSQGLNSISNANLYDQALKNNKDDCYKQHPQ